MSSRKSETRRPPWIPWWPLGAVVALSAALGLAAATGRVVEAAVIGVILLPPLALIGLWLVAWRRDRLE
jgi:hypothetical protein